MGATSPIQNTSSVSPTTPNDMNDKITVDQVPKPRKFFKSRNVAPPMASPEQQQIQHKLAQQKLLQQQASFQQSQTSSEEDEGISKSKKKNIITRKPKEKIEKVKHAKIEKATKLEKPPKPEKAVRPKKEKKVKDILMPPQEFEEEDESAELESPKRGSRNNAEPSRSSGRARNKFVNYNDDAGEDEFYQKIDRRILPSNITLNEKMIVTEQIEMVSEPSVTQLTALKYDHPPIVLRISKVRTYITRKIQHVLP